MAGPGAYGSVGVCFSCYLCLFPSMLASFSGGKDSLTMAQSALSLGSYPSRSFSVSVLVGNL